MYFLNDRLGIFFLYSVLLWLGFPFDIFIVKVIHITVSAYYFSIEYFGLLTPIIVAINNNIAHYQCLCLIPIMAVGFTELCTCDTTATKIYFFALIYHNSDLHLPPDILSERLFIFAYSINKFEFNLLLTKHHLS